MEDDRFLKSAVKFSVFNPALVQVRSVGGGIDIEKLPRNYHKFKLDFNCGLVKPDFFFTLRVYADAGSTSYSDFSFGDYRVGSACNEFKSSFWDINNAIYFSGEDLFHPDVSGVYRHFMGEAVVPAGVVYYGRVFESSGHIFVFSDEKWLGHFSRKFGMKKTVSRMETFADSVARGRQDQLLSN